MFAASAIIFTACGGGETAATEPENTEAVTTAAENETPATEEATTETSVVSITTLGDAAKGETVYNQVCMACHTAGIAGAAKLDDKARWEASAAKGFETLKSHIINGFTGEHGAMPAKGGRVDLTDQDMIDAMAYMFKTAGVDFK